MDYSLIQNSNKDEVQTEKRINFSHNRYNRCVVCRHQLHSVQRELELCGVQSYSTEENIDNADSKKSSYCQPTALTFGLYNQGI